MSDGIQPPAIKTTAAQWNAIRKAFVESAFAETSLGSLAQNVGLDGWPLKSADETPAKYIELTLEELLMMPGFNTRPKLVDQLAYVLKGILEEEGGFVLPVAKPAAETVAKATAPAKPKGVPGVKTKPEQWDKARKACRSSTVIMEMKLSSLAENLEQDSWPIPGPDETPAKYVDFSLEELSVMTEFFGKPALIDRLYTIINDNLADNEEFEEMVIPINHQLDRTDVLLQVLRKMGIPLDYPFNLLILPKAVRDTAPAEAVRTLGQFVQFYQKISEKGVVLGDVKTILQAISARDEARLAAWMPLRPGVNGFHLIEAVALVVKSLSQDELKSLLKKYGKKLDAQDDYLLKNTWQQLAKGAEQKIATAVVPLVDWFKSDVVEVQEILSAGGSMDRYLLPLGDADLELIVAHALIQALSKRTSVSSIPTIGSPTEPQSAPEPAGFLGKLKSLFTRK